jgi:hypothetical protein
MSTSSSTTTYGSDNKKPAALPRTMQFSVDNKRQRDDLPQQIETQESVVRLPSDSADEALLNKKRDREMQIKNITKLIKTQ